MLLVRNGNWSFYVCLIAEHMFYFSYYEYFHLLLKTKVIYSDAIVSPQIMFSNI